MGLNIVYRLEYLLKMLELIVKTPDLPENQSFIDLIKSMISKRFSRKKEVKSVLVVLSRTDDHRVPFKAEMQLEDEDGTLTSNALSVNTLSAFSQALARMERQLEKKRA